MERNEAFEQVAIEYNCAAVRFPPFNSTHEGYAVIKEELDELWDEIKISKPKVDRKEEIRKEATQVAAMAIRFLINCC